MTMMKAGRIHRFGGPEVLVIEDVPRPEPKAGEVLVQLLGTSVNPVDYKTREGKFPPISADKLPVTLGRDIAGMVVACGPDVGDVAIADSVYGMPQLDHGSYAEFAILRAVDLATSPATLPVVEAAAVPLAALTAWQGLFRHAGLAAGQRVLIHGAAGGVGHFAVQFAKVHGATVFATGSAADLDFVRGLGAETAIDYKDGRFEDEARDIDVVLDLIGGSTQERSWAVIKPGGILVSTVAEPDRARESAAKARPGKRYMTVSSGADLGEIARLIDAGDVRVYIAKIFDFADLVAAQTMLQAGGVRGKIAVKII